MTAVSIAMATYNGARHIGEQLRSLATQSHLPAEVVITDDGSIDETTEIIERFALTAPFPVRLHNNGVRLGYRANFMRAAELCRSELIAFSDQDDIWYANKLRLSIQPFADPKMLMVYHNADVMRANGRTIATLDAAGSAVVVHAPLSLSPWTVMRGFTQVIRRDLLAFSDLRPLSIDENNSAEHMAHDRWFYFLASVFGKIAYIPLPLAAYRQHDNNLFGWKADGNWRGTVNSILSNHSARYRQFADAARGRAEILRACEDRLEGEWLNRARAGVVQYGRLARSLTRRNALYTTAGVSDRLKTFITLLAGGDYWGHWGFGQKSLVKDACLGVLRGPSRPMQESL
jgi:glycosyltransferase involved in cell wall biosynthesis